MSAHSPGPWKFCSANADRGGCQCGLIWPASEDIHVATAHGKSSPEGEGDTPHEEMVANARLIACAPEMLAMLNEIRGRLRNNDVSDEFFSRLECMIRKASGES